MEDKSTAGVGGLRFQRSDGQSSLARQGRSSRAWPDSIATWRADPPATQSDTIGGHRDSFPDLMQNRLVTEQELPPDPAAYDAERNVQARKRGLSAAYIPGGNDPDPEAGLAEERRYLRWLVIMVIVLALAAFVTGIVAALLGYAVQ